MDVAAYVDFMLNTGSSVIFVPNSEIFEEGPIYDKREPKNHST